MEKDIYDITKEINELSKDLDKLYYFAIDHKFVPSDKLDEIYFKRLCIYHENSNYIDNIKYDLRRDNLKNDFRFLVFSATYLLSIKAQSILASLLSVYGMSDNILQMNNNFVNVSNDFDIYIKNLDRLSNMHNIINNICNYVKDSNSFAYSITFLENYFMESGELIDTDLNDLVKEVILLDHNINLDEPNLLQNK